MCDDVETGIKKNNDNTSISLVLPQSIRKLANQSVEMVIRAKNDNTFSKRKFSS